MVSIEFKRQIAQEFLGGETHYGLARRHDCFAELHPGLGGEVRSGRLRRRVSVRRPLQQYEAMIAALERLVGRQALEIEF